MANTDLKTIQILLFEDNAADANLVAEYLELSKLKNEITTTTRLSSGKALLREKHYDLILLDLSLPDSTGIETLKSIIPFIGHEVIIVLTGGDDEGFLAGKIIRYPFVSGVVTKAS